MSESLAWKQLGHAMKNFAAAAESSHIAMHRSRMRSLAGLLHHLSNVQQHGNTYAPYARKHLEGFLDTHVTTGE